MLRAIGLEQAGVDAVIRRRAQENEKRIAETNSIKATSPFSRRVLQVVH
jgi:hypothetical protein